MPLQVQPVTDADFDILIGQADNGSIGDDIVAPPCPVTWPVSTREEAQLRARCHFSWQRKRFHEDPTLRFVKVVDVGSNSEADSSEILAVARWHYYPTGYDYSQEKHWEMAPEIFNLSTTDDKNGDEQAITASVASGSYPPPNFNLPLHNHILSTRDSFRPQWIPTDGPAWMLMHLVTRPSQRRRGAAEMLVRWGQEQAARTGADAYLEAGTQGQPLYVRCGFVTVGDMRVFDLRAYGAPVDEFGIWNMRWPSSGKGEVKGRGRQIENR